MSLESARKMVTQFFNKVEVAGLKLPNGWFGRPYDNWHRLTDVHATEDEGMVIELDGQLQLQFLGQVRVKIDDNILQLSGFTDLNWNWTEYGSPVHHREHFDSGVVELVGPPI